MKHLYRTILLPLLALCSMLSLSSCYFNSAGHIFDEAYHGSAVFASDIEVGDTVYRWESDQTYYVELPRYRYDTPIITQYPDDDQKSSEKKLTRLKGEWELVRIPEDFAMYLTGQSGGPSAPSYMQPESLRSDFKQLATGFRVVRTPSEYMHTYTYESPNAVGWYMLGILDWLCIDLPMTCMENSLAATIAVVGAAEKAKKSGSSYSSSYSSGSSSGGGTCGVCGGRGYTFGGSTSNPTPVGCGACGGSGRR